MALEARDADGRLLLLELVLRPQLLRPQALPQLNLQSGLFEDALQVGNATASTNAGLGLAVSGLSFDLALNAIYLFNRQGTTSLDLDNDGLATTPADVVAVPTLAPGGALTLTMEYYVSDHRTPPGPLYTFLMGQNFSVVNPTGQALAINSARYVNGVFLVEFNTRSNLNYFIQYASTVSDLTNSATLKTAIPALRGTGNRVQWIDNGPPKTESAPTQGMRFYRVLETP